MTREIGSYSVDRIFVSVDDTTSISEYLEIIYFVIGNWYVHKILRFFEVCDFGQKACGHGVMMIYLIIILSELTLENIQYQVQPKGTLGIVIHTNNVKT